MGAALRGKLPWVLLLVSLALNLFFVAGALYSWLSLEGAGGPGEARLESVAERLALTATQRDGLVALRDRVSERREAMRRTGGAWGELLVDALQPSEFDREGFAHRLDERGQRRRQYMVEVMADLHAYLATLSPEQKTQFLELAGERGFLRRLLSRDPRR